MHRNDNRQEHEDLSSAGLRWIVNIVSFCYHSRPISMTIPKSNYATGSHLSRYDNSPKTAGSSGLDQETDCLDNCTGPWSDAVFPDTSSADSEPFLYNSHH